MKNANEAKKESMDKDSAQFQKFLGYEPGGDLQDFKYWLKLKEGNFDIDVNKIEHILDDTYKVLKKRGLDKKDIERHLEFQLKIWKEAYDKSGLQSIHINPDEPIIINPAIPLLTRLREALYKLVVEKRIQIKKMQKWGIRIGIALIIVLAITNPSMKQFKEYTGANNNERGIVYKRISNWIVFSYYEKSSWEDFNQQHNITKTEYFAIFNNFYGLH